MELDLESAMAQEPLERQMSTLTLSELVQLELRM